MRGKGSCGSCYRGGLESAALTAFRDARLDVDHIRFAVQPHYRPWKEREEEEKKMERGAERLERKGKDEEEIRGRERERRRAGWVSQLWMDNLNVREPQQDVFILIS